MEANSLLLILASLVLASFLSTSASAQILNSNCPYEWADDVTMQDKFDLKVLTPEGYNITDAVYLEFNTKNFSGPSGPL